MTSKAAIREQMCAWRAAQPLHLKQAWSEEICLHLRSDERFARARTIHSFWPMTAQGEVDLQPLLRWLRDEDRTVWLPVVQENDLLHARFTTEERLRKAGFGQEEPDGPRHRDVSPDVILVPALAIDLEGNRVGYGGGFYDRFLQSQSAWKVGVVFEGQILSDIPHESHDAPVDSLVTEAGWYHAPTRR